MFLCESWQYFQIACTLINPIENQKRMTDYITIKEIAALAKRNPLTIRRNESKWKLDSALVNGKNNKPKLYCRKKALKILSRLGLFCNH
jgi:hypothetical protein